MADSLFGRQCRRNGTSLSASLVDLTDFPLAEVAAVEYYNGPGEAPAEYDSLNTNCGALVIWRRK